QHRYEMSGALAGLQRVRGMTLNDAHIFARPDQIKEEFKRTVELIQEVYEDFNITDYYFRLSYRAPDDTAKYIDNDEMWEMAEAALKQTMDELDLPYVEAVGEAAFYGPKLDVQVKTALGQDETSSTGPMEYEGAFPTWLAPVQVEIIPVSPTVHLEYAADISNRLKKEGIRVNVDVRDEKIGYKIREAQTKKIPYALVLGDKEMDSGSVNVRRYGEKETKTIEVDTFIHQLKQETDHKN